MSEKPQTITYKTPYGRHTQPVTAHISETPESKADREYAQDQRVTRQVLRQAQVFYQEVKRDKDQQ